MHTLVKACWGGCTRELYRIALECYLLRDTRHYSYNSYVAFRRVLNPKDLDPCDEERCIKSAERI